MRSSGAMRTRYLALERRRSARKCLLGVRFTASSMCALLYRRRHVHARIRP